MKVLKTKEGYWHHNHCVSKCIYHVIFCPKYRRAVLTARLQSRFKALVKSRQKDWNFQIIEMEVMPDHVHLFLEVDPQFGIHKVVKRIKGISSRILREEFSWLKSRLPTLWTNSYFVSTVGGTPISIIKQYIESQKRSE